MGKQAWAYRYQVAFAFEAMKSIITFGKIMLRLSPPGFLRFCQAHTVNVRYGGDEANVVVSRANYGDENLMAVEEVETLMRRDASGRGSR